MAEVDNTTAERKTANASGAQLNISQAEVDTASAGANVLNNYRSVAYNFTLAALRHGQLNDPQLFNPNNLDLIVATTKGKASTGLSNTVSDFAKPTNTTQASSDQTQSSSSAVPNASNQTASSDNSDTAMKAQQNRKQALAYVADQVTGFNQISPGRFDMFVDDVNIVSTFKFNEASAASLPTEMSFEIIEPYSLNGFIEALQASALGAGYPDYLQCSYVMVMDFTGYPDGVGLPEPVPIPGSLRYFFIKITEVEATVTQEGTRYKCKAVIRSDLNFGKSISSLRKQTAIEGNTVADLLKDLQDGLNKQTIESDVSKGIGTNEHDKYEIVCPELDENNRMILGSVNVVGQGKFEPDKTSKVTVKMSNIDSTKSAYGNKPISPTQAAQQSSSDSTPPVKHTAQFDSGVPIHDVISAIVRDSTYVTDVLKAFNQGGDPNTVVKDQMINYFVVVPEVIDNPGTYNPVTNGPYRTYRYMVLPYKMVYNTAVPGQNRQYIDDKKLKKYTLRNYNYIYSGNNVDVVDFKINFNTLFYEALPKGLGNPPKNTQTTDGKASNTNESNTKQKDQTPQLGGNNTIPTAPRTETVDASSNQPGNTPNASAPNGSPWQQMVKVMHEAIVNSKGSLISGELSILGDPYYLTANGSGNYAGKKGDVGKTSGNQEASVRSGQVLININFNNPIDINKATGMMQFEQLVLPFSGIYMVTEVKSEFKNGLFKQTLTVNRIPGQPQNSQQVPDDLTNQFGSAPNPQDQISQDTAPPGSGNPVTNDGTQASNQTALNVTALGYTANGSTPGGLGGSSNPVFGATNPSGGLPSSVYSIVPNGTNQLATGIRASTQGIFNAQNALLGTAATVNAVANIFGSTSPVGPSAVNNIANVATNVNSNISKQLTSPLLNASNNVTGAINGVESSVNYAIYGATNSINKAFGINASGITGLTGALSSNLLNKLLNTPSSLPANVNLASAAAQGILINKLPTLTNIPAIPVPFKVLRDPGFIGGNPVTPATANATFEDPLANLYSLQPQVDNTVQSGKLGSSIGLFNKTANVNASSDGTQLAIGSVLGINSTKLSSSVNNLYGSVSNNNSVSPLVAALNNQDNTSQA